MHDGFECVCVKDYPGGKKLYNLETVQAAGYEMLEMMYH